MEFENKRKSREAEPENYRKLIAAWWRWREGSTVGGRDRQKDEKQIQRDGDRHTQKRAETERQVETHKHRHMQRDRERKREGAGEGRKTEIFKQFTHTDEWLIGLEWNVRNTNTEPYEAHSF